MRNDWVWTSGGIPPHGGFQKIGVPANHLIFSEFSLINHPFWGYMDPPKCLGVGLMLTDGQVVNVSQSAATKRPLSPKFDRCYPSLAANVGEYMMDKINRDMGDTVRDETNFRLFLGSSTCMFDLWTSEWMLKHDLYFIGLVCVKICRKPPFWMVKTVKTTWFPGTFSSNESNGICLWGLFIILLSLPIAYAGMPRPSTGTRLEPSIFFGTCVQIIPHIIYASLSPYMFLEITSN